MARHRSGGLRLLSFSLHSLSGNVGVVFGCPLCQLGLGGAQPPLEGLDALFERLYLRRVFGGDLSGPLCKLGGLPFGAGLAYG